MNEASNNNNNNKILSVCKGFAISKGMSIKKHRKTMKTEWIKKKRTDWQTKRMNNSSTWLERKTMTKMKQKTNGRNLLSSAIWCDVILAQQNGTKMNDMKRTSCQAKMKAAIPNGYRERESASARSISMVWPKLECIAGCWMFCMFVFICTGKRLRRSYLTCACLPRFLWLWLILSSHFPLRFVQKYFSLLWWR